MLAEWARKLPHNQVRQKNKGKKERERNLMGPEPQGGSCEGGKHQIKYKGIPIRLTAEFSAVTIQARRKWHDIFKEMKGKNLEQRILYPVRFSFRFDGEIKTFTDKQKLREFSTTKLALQQMVKELL